MNHAPAAAILGLLLPILVLAACRSPALKPAPVHVAGAASSPSGLVHRGLVVPVDVLKPTGSERWWRRARSPRWEPFVGAGYGVSLAGNQDLKLIRRSAGGEILDYLFTADLDASIAPIAAAYVGAWLPAHVAPRFGFQVDVAHWATTVEADEFVRRGPGVTPPDRPPFWRIRQQRVSVFGTLLWRFAPPWRPRFDARRTCLYAGLGGGRLWSQVEHGATRWGWGVQVVAGAIVPHNESVRLRVELRYMVAPDADSPRRVGWRVDTSGTGYFPGFAHHDTRFFALLVGCELRL